MQINMESIKQWFLLFNFKLSPLSFWKKFSYFYFQSNTKGYLSYNKPTYRSMSQ